MPFGLADGLAPKKKVSERNPRRVKLNLSNIRLDRDQTRVSSVSSSKLTLSLAQFFNPQWPKNDDAIVWLLYGRSQTID